MNEINALVFGGSVRFLKQLLSTKIKIFGMQCSMTMKISDFERRKEDKHVQTTVSEILVIFPKEHQDDNLAQSVYLDGPQSMSLNEYSQEVSTIMRSLVDAVQTVSTMRRGKMKQFSEMLSSLENMDDNLVSTQSNVSETHLMALNTLINASRCGFKARSLVDIVNEVTQVCHQSESYLASARQAVQEVTMTLKSVNTLVGATIKTDINLFSIIKGQVDHQLGRISAGAELLSVIKHSNTGTQSPTSQLCEKLNEDVAELGSVLQAALRYLKTLAQRLSREGVSVTAIEQAQRQLAIFSSAELIIKIS